LEVALALDMKISDKLVNPIHGFAGSNGYKDEKVSLISHALLTSDDPEFYRYIETFEKTFLHKHNIFIDSVNQFLVVIHHDLTTDTYINDFAVASDIVPKRDMKAGAVVSINDIGDIRSVRFPNIDISESDKVIYVFKAGWRFGMFFDFGSLNIKKPEEPTVLNLENMAASIGDLRRRLSFYQVYKTLEAKDHFLELRADGWFPFIALLGGEYVELSKIYTDRFNFDERIKKIINRFDEKRINEITSNWWRHPVFESKRKLIQAGVRAYSQDTEDGNINCIKNLSTELEGILRALYLVDIGRGSRVKSSELIDHIIAKGRVKAVSDTSLLLPSEFLEYLRDVVFANFDVEQAPAALSRNSSSHGVADPHLYTRERALQLILALDQIHYYLQADQKLENTSFA
jgi:hypothetical protein